MAVSVCFSQRVAGSTRKHESAFLEMFLTDCHKRFEVELEKKVSSSENETNGFFANFWLFVFCKND